MDERTYEDAFNLLCGDVVGSGMTRTVYECNVDPTLVAKVESAELRTHFQNLIEWHVWNRVSGTLYERWFAPIYRMSPDGRLLLMRRTEPLQRKQLPARMPSFFTDFKISNFGMFKGRVVCHDYGTNLLMEVGMNSRTKSVQWRGEIS